MKIDVGMKKVLDMKKIILSVYLSLLLNNSVLADSKCFVAVEDDHVLKQEGDCNKRHSPYSTFKIALSLMGYDSAILIDENNPKLEFKEEYSKSLSTVLNQWKQPQNPKLWIKNSAVWYSIIITKQLGVEKFRDYVMKFNYGNQDISGDKGKNNALTHSWLSSSLQISPNEQITFLKKLLADKLPVSKEAHKMTKNILYVDELKDDWKLYAKTGSGATIGWYVGWTTNSNRTIIFAYYIEDDYKIDTSPISKRAKQQAREKLIELIKNIN